MNNPVRVLRSDGEITRTRILEAAGELFASLGYAQTANKAIAVHAKVDIASINYHFGNRSELYQAVLAESYGQIPGIANLEQLMSSGLKPELKLRALIEQLVRHALQDPQSWQLQVLARELLAPTIHLHTLFQNEALPKVGLLRCMLSDITNVPAKDPALTRCMLFLIAPCLMLLVGGRTFPGPLEEVFRMPSHAIADHLYRYAIGGLRAISSEIDK